MREEVIFIYSQKQGHSRWSAILPLKWDIFKSKMKVKYSQRGNFEELT